MKNRVIEPWAGEVVAELHMKRITQSELADEVNVTPQFISMVLSGAKNSSTIEKRIREAISRIEKRREAEMGDEPHDGS